MGSSINIVTIGQVRHQQAVQLSLSANNYGNLRRVLEAFINTLSLERYQGSKHYHFMVHFISLETLYHKLCNKQGKADSKGLYRLKMSHQEAFAFLSIFQNERIDQACNQEEINTLRSLYMEIEPRYL